ncbi:hypothetical protein COA08_09525 [Bacillus cereus]|uniref:Uncharacterized protein n=1 Tax=Bacillus cereus TaxID=1396 RepID=A0A2A8U0J2_BACCE|nr:hypothetical protein [Bacillus cereus]PDY82099.1 hypothetical protein CON06_11165 [Bacillus cereus]PFA10420.1 hypothetical protein CN382_21375 [Bacillus cereus]PFM42026.1 hypothetical protein COJ43_06870 [Bacillus cereus]PGL63627.1 hypothetical protein CN927_04175 [Bacillus cereus]PGQ10395.1 hypothetical protein COA08_09525 [Bacillus cereus]
MHIIHIVNGWCKFWELKLVESILHDDAKSYVRSIDYVGGNLGLMFTIRVFYRLINHDNTLGEAVREARLIDEGTCTFRVYKQRETHLFYIRMNVFHI